MSEICFCPICGGHDFSSQNVLWQELVADWQLSPREVEYIDLQQGFACTTCGNNLRSMSLADAILRAYRFSGTLAAFVQSDLARALKILEINEAGGLSAVLAKLPNHQLVRYPEYDMTDLVFGTGTFDLVVHSDTLEHVPHPVAGLAECRRILRAQGRCIFTVPIIVDRMTRSRAGLKNSYHGVLGQEAGDFVVHNEFGADVWRYAAEAGFDVIKIHNFNYPAGLAIEVSANE
jgi:SAM-dependent methyltransferase